MAVTHLFAGFAVADLATARAFYERVFDRPPDLVPHAGEVCWRLTETAWVNVLEEPARAGGAEHTALVDDLDTLVADLAARGITATVTPVGDAGRKARVADPDGNVLAFAEVDG